MLSGFRNTLYGDFCAYWVKGKSVWGSLRVEVSSISSLNKDNKNNRALASQPIFDSSFLRSLTSKLVCFSLPSRYWSISCYKVLYCSERSRCRILTLLVYFILFKCYSMSCNSLETVLRSKSVNWHGFTLNLSGPKTSVYKPLFCRLWQLSCMTVKVMSCLDYSKYSLYGSSMQCPMINTAD